MQKQPPRRVLSKRCSENMQQIYKRTAIPKCDFNKDFKITLRHSCSSVNLQSLFIDITLWHGCSPVNLLHIFRTAFTKNTSASVYIYFYIFLYIEI